MAKRRKKRDKNFLLQGSILAIAGVITKIIGVVYRIPLTNIVGKEGMGYYSVAFSIYTIALMLTSYSLPLAVSKLVSARVAVGQYKNAYKVFRCAMIFAFTAGVELCYARVRNGGAGRAGDLPWGGFYCCLGDEDGYERLCAARPCSLYPGCCGPWRAEGIFSGQRLYDANGLIPGP